MIMDDETNPPSDAPPSEEEMSPEEKAMMDEWAAAGEEGGESTKELSQDEIDNLMGFDDIEKPKAGVEAILANTSVTYERLPMLEVVFDRLVRLLSTTLRNFTSENVEVSLDEINAMRFGDFINSIPLPAILGVFTAVQWQSSAIITVNSSLIYSVIDVLLGGTRGIEAMRVDGRPYTTIERTLIERMMVTILNDMSTSFEPVADVNFEFDRLEINPRFASISRPSDTCVYVRMNVDMEGRGGKIELAIPYGTLEPVREKLTQMFMGEKFGQDSIWENHLAEALYYSGLSIDAILDEKLISLNEILNWEPGSQIMLSVKPTSPIQLRCGDIPVFWGYMGQHNNNIAVKISQFINNKSGEKND